MEINMQTQVDRHIIDQMEDGHSLVMHGYKDTIKGAIMAGEALVRARELCQHGEFEAVVSSRSFSRRTAFQYIKVYEYSAKVQQLAHLQEAYKLIESEEAKKKLAKEESQRSKFAYRRKYNEKPDSWTRDDDYAWKRIQEEDIARNKRIADLKKEMDESAQQKRIDDESIDAGLHRLREHFDNEQAKIEKLKSLNITNQNGGILDLLGNYLAGLSTDSQRIEECHNIIKYCKSVSAKLQQVK